MKRSMIIWCILLVLVVILFALVMGRTTITFSPFSVHMNYPWNFAAWMFFLCAGICWTMDSSHKSEQASRETIMKYMEKLKKIAEDDKVSNIHVQLNNIKQSENGN